jgi:hypothetical protein
MFSNWVALNEYELRYFIYPYLFISFALVFYLDSISGKLKLILQLTYVSAILSFCVTTFQFQCINYKHDPRNFSLERVKQLKQLENGGVIGDYWYSYALALNSEMNIKATAHEYDYIRNSVMADSVLLRKNIFVVANQWLNSFPDTLTQFGLNLIRNGEPQKINEIDFCNYRLSSFPLVYYPKSPEQLKGNLTTFLKEKTLIPFTTDSNKVYYSEWFVYGPYSKIPPGKYKIRFQLHFTPGFKQNGSITFDTSENSGEIIHSSKTVVFNEDLLPSADEYVLDFSIEKMINMGEYRIKLNGIFSFEFKSIIVEKVR